MGGRQRSQDPDRGRGRRTEGRSAEGAVRGCDARLIRSNASALRPRARRPSTPTTPITIQDIAARSTINRATFYVHFVDKYDLFAQFSRDWFRSALQLQLSCAAQYSPANLRSLVLATLHAMGDMNDHCRPTETLKPLIVAAVQEELAKVLRAWLEPVVAGGGGAELESAVAALSWAIFGAALQWSQLPTRPPAEPTATQLATLLTHGLPS
ncbi:MAG: TetR/AcrR family transcriptional regulator [Chloroflexi bacterium]|nr:MAG: TetR/AcrR family transcriptional regulator [Chloroflexota bacterium]